MLTLEEFKKMELIVARIKEVREHPNADKLYVMTIATGSGDKQLVAGIRTSYGKDELVGRQIIVINNLEPAVIRGEESQGMLLAVGEPGNVALLKPDRETPEGSRVR